MLNRFLVLVMLILSIVTIDACNPSPSQLTETRHVIDSIKNVYATDLRTSIFDVSASVENGTVILKGETSNPQINAALHKSLFDKQIPSKIDIKILPESQLDKTYALINNSVSNLRSDPSHSAELVTQAIMGTPLKVYKHHGNWYLVQTPDHYIAWVDDGGIYLMDSLQLQKYKSLPKVMYVKQYGFSYDSTNNDYPVTDLVAGSILELTDSTQAYYHTKLPDGRTALVKKDEARPYDQWLSSLHPTGDDLKATAFSLRGIPYLWGGTSTKGVDCSGFTKTVYFMNGFILPRDASQQVHEGKVVDDQRQFDLLKTGDLLFFGRPATDTTSEKVVHVGMWIGNNRFIHSSGNVHVSSMDTSDELYDDYNFNRYLRAVRILGEHNTPGILDLRKEEIY